MRVHLTPTFPNYIQLRDRSRIPSWLWEIARAASVNVVFILAAVLIMKPDLGLFILWKLAVPVLPMIFLVAPGFWRNVCPMAAFNQTPRQMKFSRALTPPRWLQKYGYSIGMVSFFVLASSRKWLFNQNGLASGLLVLGGLTGAFVGGYFFKGKSGWCSSMCPLYPIQRLYNQTPFKMVANQYCTPCLACTKNCYDFSPGTASLEDLEDTDRHYTNARKFYTAAMPGFILAFFTLPDVPAISPLSMYAQMSLYMLLSVALFTVVDTFIMVSANKISAIWGATAFSMFYWFVFPGWLTSVTGLVDLSLPVWTGWIGRGSIIILALVWVRRTYVKERNYVAEKKPAELAVTQAATATGEVSVQFGDTAVTAPTDESLLNIAENNNMPIEAGCRMGICGADAVTVVEGMENLSPMGEDERATLERMGAGKNTRLACMCRVKGDVCVSLGASEGDGPTATDAIELDESVKQVVVIGNGIAGVTAADTIRRYHPDCDIHLIGREKHPLYNRMGIGRLIYGRSAMSGLYLKPEEWYEQRKITSWLNTQVTQISKENKEIVLATGEALPYDKLILACGSSSFVPPLPGFGLPGTYVLREADEAMEIRTYAQAHRCSRAVIAGGGLLGIEAGYALQKLGLHVTILERGPWLLRRQLDEKSGRILQQHLEQLGMEVRLESEVAMLYGNERLEKILLKEDGQPLLCDIFLMAAGIRPNTQLADSVGLAKNQGVIVTDRMQTTVPGIFAVGDMCEYDGKVPGLWAVAMEQARVAALNAVGGHAVYKPVVPATTLKVVGVDVTSVGRIEALSTDREIVLVDEADLRYRKLVIAEGRIVGAILLGYPKEAAAVTNAIKQGWDVTSLLPALAAGRWSVLRQQLANLAN